MNTAGTIEGRHGPVRALIMAIPQACILTRKAPGGLEVQCRGLQGAGNPCWKIAFGLRRIRGHRGYKPTLR